MPTETLWNQQDQDAGFSLPARYFYDEDIYQRERSAIFLKSWHLVAHVGELRAPGDFVTHEIFDQSVLASTAAIGWSRHGAATPRWSSAAIMPGLTSSMASCAGRRARRVLPGSTRRNSG